MPGVLYGKEAGFELFKLSVWLFRHLFESTEAAGVCMAYLAIKSKSMGCLLGV